MGKRSEQEPAAIRLYAEGVEIPQISAELGVSENSLRQWKKRAGSEWDEARDAFRKGRTASYEGIGRRIQRSQELANDLTGDARNQSRMGLMLNQALQTVIWDLIDKIPTIDDLDLETMTASIDQVKGLALTLQRTEMAAANNLKRDAEIRRQVLDEVSKKVDEVTQVAGNQVMTAEAFQKILKETYGA